MAGRHGPAKRRPVAVTPKPDTTTVAIIGSGPAGLSLAIELGHRGVPCTIFERSPRAGHAPRAKTTHSRTREHMRRWGIAGKLAEASPFGVDYPSHVMFVTRLGGHLLHRFEHALDCNPARDEHYSEHGQWIPQYRLEKVLLDHALSLPGVRILYGQEFTDYAETGSGVTVRLRDVEDGSTHEMAASYLVGADGSGSTVRDRIDATMQGSYGLSRNLNIIFRAPGLAGAHPHGPGIMFWQINPDLPSLIGPMDQGDLWYFMPTGVDGANPPTPAEAEAMIRKATGIDTEIEVLSSDTWVASKLLADRFRNGRAFLVGDAGHLHPPFGGFGMLLGVGDAVDLGWKIAAVLAGWGGEGLLDSYEIERRQTAQIVLDAAEANHTILANQLILPHLEEDSPAGEAARAEAAALVRRHKRAEFYARGVVLGYCYRGSPVVVDDGSQQDWVRSLDYVPAAIPGCIAPHCWLADGSSLYDHFGAGFTLLATGPGLDAEIARAEAEARQAGVPLTVIAPGDDRLPGLYAARLALIRPDQHVAWRGDAFEDGVFAVIAGQRAAVPA
ncbi:FAD-monooxygenase [Paracoccus siganidrum]|uniref:FAD-monooxygenase n=1 Tax=Paracoccus siganidrum TaxID=1276757 RepID=A0A418ZZI4_9RHOB|nr:FAD-monooxygenase [Paracoccus siganidrum]RMC30014.1 FAD-monooxygenase [Paracoccus siganidrum]